MQIFRRKLVTHFKPVVIALIVVLQIYSVIAAIQLAGSVTERTVKYLDEITTLACNLLDARFHTVLTGLNGLSAELAEVTGNYPLNKLPEDVRNDIEARLKSYDNVWDYTHLFVASPDGDILAGVPTRDPNWRVVLQHTLDIKRSSFGRTESLETILYGVPLVREGRIEAVLMAERSSIFALSMVSSESFHDKGIALLIGSDGKALFKIVQSQPHKGPLGALPLLDENDRLRSEAFGSNFSFKERGRLSFEAPDGEPWFVSCIPLRTFDCSIMFVGSHDLIMQKEPVHIGQNLALTGLSFILILLLLWELRYLQNAYNQQLAKVEFTDALTGGHNAQGFGRHMKKLLADKNYALILLDVNRFKVVNSIYGVDKANELLVLIHATLSGHIASDELCARDGSDQFLLLLKYHSEDRLRARLDALMEEIMERKHSLGIRHKYGLSAGVYVIEDTSQPAYVMRDMANTARQFCKHPPHPRCTFYDASLGSMQRIEGAMINDFSHALERGDFQIWFQPKVNIRTDVVSGCEALVRWQHPELGLLTPDTFLQILEDNGRIMELDLYVFEQVCRTLARWDREGREIIPVSVNLSRLHLRRHDFLSPYLDILHQYQLKPHWLELELTETLFTEDSMLISQAFDAIRSHGMRCAIDDFGTGYSSLSILRDANVDTIKLDRSFFGRDELDAPTKAVIHTITQLATALGLTCVAEGVDDASMVDFLRTTDCSLVQGYTYSKPLPIEEFEAFAYTKEGRRRFLNTRADNSPGELLHHVRSLRSAPIRNILSSLGNLAVYVIKKDTHELLYFNQRFAEVLPQAKPGMLCHEVLTAHCMACPLSAGGSQQNSTLCLKHSPFGNGVEVAAAECLWDDYIPAFIVSIISKSSQDEEKEEITALRETAAVWKKRAYEDDLTRLLRKNRFKEETEMRIAANRPGALIIIDLDGFKQVNDSLGHQMGDKVLRKSSERIRMSFRTDDVIGRYGGDEFIVFTSGFMEGDIFEQRLRTLQALMRHTHSFGSMECAISASIGIARFPQDAQNYRDLVKKADIALYEAKRRGKDQHVFFEDCLDCEKALRPDDGTE